MNNPNSREWWLLAIIFAFFGVLYIYGLTHSGLWFDESIEYYYSKYLTGPVPVNPVDQSGNNMYERICITYQPPLYNILMYFWLLLFDSEVGFRLAGVIVTFIGSFGFYFAIRRLAGYIWGILGLCFYLSTAAVFYSALECSEYNLMLCMECWMLYYYVVCVQSPSIQVSYHALIGFFLFAALSVYSQYGAVFFAVALFISLCLVYIKSKNFVSIRRLFIMGACTIIIAIIPLLFYFIQVQMGNQGSIVVDHHPVFVGHFLGGVPYSLFKSFYEQVMWIFYSSLIWGWTTESIMRVAVSIVFISTLVSIFLRSRISVLIPSVIASIVCYILFFVMSACSLYAYNSWDGQLGCYNIIEHTRYVLFIVPLFVFTFFIGIISLSKYISQRGHKRIAEGYIFVVMVVFIANALWGGVKGKIKSDGREVTYAWLNQKDDVHKVVVQEWLAGTFMFYYQHSDACNDVMSDKIILTRQDMRIPEKIEPHLRSLGVFDLPAFYFVGSKSAIGMNNGEGIQIISDLFTNNGYKVKTIWKGTSELLFISK